MCKKADANTTVKDFYTKLKNCPSTAAKACTMPTLTTAENDIVANCNTSLDNYVKAFQVKLYGT